MTVIKYLIPTQGIMVWPEMLTATQGMTIEAYVFDPYWEKIAGDILSWDKGSLLTFEDHMVTLFGC